LREGHARSTLGVGGNATRELLVGVAIGVDVDYSLK
jgi:hypothetical protein